MLAFIKYYVQIAAIICFIILTIIGAMQKDWNFGCGLNAALVMLYVFLYLQPIK